MLVQKKPIMNDACAIETHKKKITVNILYDIKN